MRELLALSEGLPLREVEPGDVLVREGERSGALYVLDAVRSPWPAPV